MIGLSLTCMKPRTLSLLTFLGLANAPMLAHAGAKVEADRPLAHEPDTVEILGGTATAVGDFKSVVAVRLGGGLCTGTLIDKEWVLVAAHCVTPSLLGLTTQAEVTAQTKVVFDTVDVRAAGGIVVNAKQTIPHPMFDAESIVGHDFGLIQLVTPVTDRTPSLVNFDAAAAPVGITVTLVGYGKTEAGSAGKQYVLRNRTSESCQELDATLLCFDQTDSKGVCNGDSGGPAFGMINGREYIVGVASFVTSADCMEGGAHARPDADKAFIVDHVPALLCATDGTCNQTCGKGGAPIDADCPTCVKDQDCGDGKVCVSSQCQPEPFAPGGTGGECTANAQCASGQCGQVGTEQRCVQNCNLAANDCPTGFDCLSVGGAAGACWPAAADGEGGCCSVGTAPHDVAPLALFVGAVLLFGGRRRKSRA